MAAPTRCGRKELVDTTTGELTTVYDSADELDGTTYVKCGNRRAADCESCSAEYKGDAWHLILAGLAGGKGVPDSVAAHPCTFATLTAPSFGPVHGVRRKGPCRARREKPLCPHGRPLWCGKRYGDDDSHVGQPLCGECYDYTAHVLWQWHAPELWRRFTIALQRDLAKKAGLPVTRFRAVCKISYSKVVEFQARGAIHVHVPIRLDGPEGPDGQGKERLAAGPKWCDEDLVFPTTIGTPIEPDNLSRSWYLVRKVLGEPAPRFHDIRHTCVGLLLAEGAPPHIVQQIVGHSAIDVTMTIYAHASLDEKRTALQKLGERLA